MMKKEDITVFIATLFIYIIFNVFLFLTCNKRSVIVLIIFQFKLWFLEQVTHTIICNIIFYLMKSISVNKDKENYSMHCILITIQKRSF